MRAPKGSGTRLRVGSGDHEELRWGWGGRALHSVVGDLCRLLVRPYLPPLIHL